jgi:methionine-gamma-lyase
MRSMMNEEFGFGGILGVDLGDPELANRLIETLQKDEGFGWIAVSLGYFDTLMSVSAASTSSELNHEDQDKAGISPGYLRLSIGYSGALEQRWEQMERALDRVGLAPRARGVPLIGR